MLEAACHESSNGARISLLVATEQALIGELLTHEFGTQRDLHVVGVAAEFGAALELAVQTQPKVALIDAGLRDRGAFRLLQGLRLLKQTVRAVILADDVYVYQVREALRLGAAGYHTKREPLARLEAAVRHAARGERSFCDELAAKLVETPEGLRLAPPFRYAPLETLSQRELDVLLFLVQGITVKDCAKQLLLAESTVDNHRTRIMRKLRLHRTIDLVRLAIRERLIPND